MKNNEKPLNRIGIAGMAIVLLAGLSGCGLSSLTSGLGSSVLGGSSPSETGSTIGEISEEQLIQAAKANVDSDITGSIANANLSNVSHGCPKVIIRPKDNHMTIYEDGRIGDSLAVRHRGEITKTARECVVNQGRVTVKYGFSGRVLLGPRGTSGNVVLPVQVFVADKGQPPVASDQLQVTADIAVDRPIGYFSAVRSVTFDVPQGTRAGDFAIYLAFPQTQAQPLGATTG